MYCLMRRMMLPVQCAKGAVLLFFWSTRIGRIVEVERVLRRRIFFAAFAAMHSC